MDLWCQTTKFTHQFTDKHPNFLFTHHTLLSYTNKFLSLSVKVYQGPSMIIVNFREVPLATQLLIPTTTEHPWKPSARPLNQPDPGHQQPLSLSQFDTKAGSLGLGCWGKSWRNSLLHFKTKRLPVALSVRENYYQSSWSCSIISQGKNIFHLKCKVNC